MLILDNGLSNEKDAMNFAAHKRVTTDTKSLQPIRHRTQKESGALSASTGS